jgi:hypothetical protein
MILGSLRRPFIVTRLAARPGPYLAACPLTPSSTGSFSTRDQIPGAASVHDELPRTCIRSSDRTACTDPLRLAVAAYLARFTGSSRKHTESDLRCFLTWCAEHGLDPLTVCRHFSVVAGSYRTCVIDDLRIFEATGADITDLGEEHGHRMLRVCGEGTRPPPQLHPRRLHVIRHLTH